MSDNCRVSEALYVGLCGYVGTPTEVTIRREVMDMEEMIWQPVQIHRGCRSMDSGSHREGFRFKSSDRDWMFWSTNHKVITDLSQSSVYDLSKHTIILMEETDTPPGFVKLQLLTPPWDGHIGKSVVPFSDGMYISSERWRKIALTFMMENRSFSNTIHHGPCASGIHRGTENDYAVCFHCSYWSRLTCYWRQRCTLHNWPPNDVFDEILRNGCHFVPVGSKIAGDENVLEWRLSFSRAEQKLVYSMNHTQFLCYGLLKLFLKEVVNRATEEPFLCSYFVKTTMFWLIQIGHITWSPNTLLDCFWKCFKFLLHCVYRGVLPNFFIPQNNMFVSKLSTVKGVRTRDYLLAQLNWYYEMGVTCLLQSPTVRKMIEPVICNNLFRIEPLLGHIKSAADTDACIKKETHSIRYSSEDLGDAYFILRFIIVLSNQSLTEYKTLTLQQGTAEVLVYVAFTYLNSSTVSTNKTVYRSDRLIGNLLKLAGRVGDVSWLLYLALYYYRTCRYREALHVTALVKSRLTRPYIMYGTVDRDRYNESVAGWSLSKRMKKAWAYGVRLDSDVYCIQELALEQNVSKENGDPDLNISPYVVTDMLSVLCNYRLGNRSQCLQSLTDLQTLLLYDDGKYVPLPIRDLSWQILGICQQVVGDLHGALQSYQQSLRQETFHKIQNASKYRIALILNRFNERNVAIF
uniref:Mab-21-like HhH/H2TH-like domain-containing protein n=1 Tax=Magallana gigas TaxID=29159 RepID=A0A8W8IHS4_MAGGI